MLWKSAQNHCCSRLIDDGRLCFDLKYLEMTWENPGSFMHPASPIHIAPFYITSTHICWTEWHANVRYILCPDSMNWHGNRTTLTAFIAHLKCVQFGAKSHSLFCLTNVSTSMWKYKSLQIFWHCNMSYCEKSGFFCFWFETPCVWRTTSSKIQANLEKCWWEVGDIASR